LRAREEAITKEKEAIDEQVSEKLRHERGKIAADEAKKAKLALANDLDQRAKEIAELQEVVKQRDAKLGEAQRAQADLLRKQRELEDAKRELDLTVEKRVQRWAGNHSGAGSQGGRGALEAESDGERGDHRFNAAPDRRATAQG